MKAKRLKKERKRERRRGDIFCIGYVYLCLGMSFSVETVDDEVFTEGEEKFFLL